VARITCKELKTGKFALEVGHIVDLFEEHHTEIVRYGAAALAVAIIVILILVYRSLREHPSASLRRKRFSSVANSAGKQYASLAELSLCQLYFSEGKPKPGEEMLRSLMEKPKRGSWWIRYAPSPAR
jgi:hypothetical protein